MVLATAALVLPIAGCGDSGGDGATSSSSGGGEEATGKETASLSKAEFIKQADAVCSSGGKQIEAKLASYLKAKGIKKIGESGESPAETEAHQIEVIETIAIPELRSQIEKLKALQAPSGDEAEVKAYIATSEEGVEKGEQDPQSFFTSAQKVFAKSDDLAQSYGFKVCGNRKG